LIISVSLGIGGNSSILMYTLILYYKELHGLLNKHCKRIKQSRGLLKGLPESSI